MRIQRGEKERQSQDSTTPPHSRHAFRALEPRQHSSPIKRASWQWASQSAQATALARVSARHSHRCARSADMKQELLASGMREPGRRAYGGAVVWLFLLDRTCDGHRHDADVRDKQPQEVRGAPRQLLGRALRVARAHALVAAARRRGAETLCETPVSTAVSLGVLCVKCWPFLIGVYRARRKARIVGERHALLRHATQ